ncbi:MAG: cobalamin-dependent protein [Nanoarchaeota archaeon]|nr:cobalamin-dependent protein [Nanoarchaeota archaeon]
MEGNHIREKTLNILLVGPYKAGQLRIGQYLSPPIGIYRIKSYLEKNTPTKVDVIDCDLDGKARFLELLETKEYDIIGFSLLYQTLKNDLELMHLAKKKARNRPLLIAGGQGAVFSAEFLFKNACLDMIVKGFGEISLEAMILALQKGADMKQIMRIPGLSIRSGKKIVDTGLVPPYTQKQFEKISDSLDFSIIPYERYWDYMQTIYTDQHLRIMRNEGMLKTIRLASSSHCPMKCKFCSSTNFLDNATGCQKPLLLAPQSMLALLVAAKESHPAVTSFYFCDDDFLQDKKRVIELCRLIEADGHFKENSFFCLSRVDHVDDETLKAMKQAGFKFIIYGVESFSRKILEDMNKKITRSEPSSLINAVVTKTLLSGLTPLMNIILFYPTTTIQDIIDTIEQSVALIEKGARLTVYRYVEFYPGSEIAKEGSFELTETEFSISNRKISVPEFILPNNPLVKMLADKAIKLSEDIRESILARYAWNTAAPHPLQGISLFMATYSLLGKDYSRIETLANKIMEEAVTEKNISGDIICCSKICLPEQKRRDMPT